MNVILINPYRPYPYSKGDNTYNRFWPPLSLANSAAILERAGYTVKVLDAHAERILPQHLRPYIKNYDKVFISSSPLDRWVCPNVDISHFLESVRYVREETDEIYVLGYHGTVEPEKIFDLTKAKAIIVGEPEYTILEICKNKSLSEIEGLYFKKDGKAFLTPQRPLLDLNSLPLPAYHLLNFKRYFYEVLGSNFALFEMSRGCKFRCKFCNNVMYGEGVRIKPLEHILKEIKMAVEEYNIKTAYFIDLDFLSNKVAVNGLCDYLIQERYQLKWTCQTRPDLLDADTLKKMKAAGCQLIHMGVESGSQEALDSLRKKISIADIERAFKLCRKIGIQTAAFFIFGLSRETAEDRKSNFEFIKNINPDFISLHKLYRYRGTDMLDDHVNSDKGLDKFIRNALISYYLRPSRIFKLRPWVLLKGLKLFCANILR